MPRWGGRLRPGATLATERSPWANARAAWLAKLDAARKEKGAPSPVPEWVLSPDEVRGVVVIEHDRAQDVVEAKPELARYRFALRVVDPRRQPGANMRIVRPVTRGVLALKLESGDDAARIDVAAAGKPVAGMPVARGTSGRRVEVDFRKLPGGLRLCGFLDATFTRTSPRTLRTKTSYRVVAEARASSEGDPRPPGWAGAGSRRSSLTGSRAGG